MHVYTVFSIFQSTLPRRERHQTGSPYRRILLISIHAPAEGATYNRSMSRRTLAISIHAPAEGATASDEYDFTTMIVFQSTLPRRERLHQSAINGYGLSISIHAPAEGATDPELALAFHQSISIHAPAEGATCFPVGVLCGGDQFQSTLPRRERPAAVLSMSFALKFQSTLPRRERHDPFKFYTADEIFQSTLPRRERHLSCCILLLLLYFNPRSRGGSDKIQLL